MLDSVRRFGLELLGVFACLALWFLAWHRPAPTGKTGLTGVLRLGANCEGRVISKQVYERLVITSADLPEIAREGSCLRWTGSLVVPEPGWYRLATASDGGSSVQLDGNRLVDNQGQHAQRLVGSRATWLVAGAHSIVVDYALASTSAQFELLWEVPGRRWFPEPIPGPLLDPAPPESLPHADRGAPRERGRRDGYRVLGLIAAPLFLLMWLGRRGMLLALRYAQSQRVETGWILLVTAIALLARTAAAHTAGPLWEEAAPLSGGTHFWTALLAHDGRPEAWLRSGDRAPLGQWIYGVPVHLGLGLIGARWLSAVMGAVTCGLVAVAGQRWFGLRIGAVAGLLLALMPRAVAYQGIAGVESPSALFFTAATVSGFEAVRLGSARLYLWWGLWAGLAISVGPANAWVLLLGLMGLLIQHWSEVRRTGLIPVPVAMLLGVGTAGLAAAATWPSLWLEAGRALSALATHQSNATWNEYFLGTLQRPPVNYLTMYLLATAPVLVVVGVLAFLLRIGLRRERAAVTVAAWLLVPLLGMSILQEH